MKLSPLLAAMVFALSTVPTVVRSQTTFDLSSSPVATDDITGDFTFSLADMGPIQSDGSASYPGIGDIAWTAGTPAQDIFTVGMLDEFGFKNLSLDQIGNTTGQNVANGSLETFPLIQSLTVSQLASAVPGLAETPINDVAPIAALANQQGVSLLNGTVGQLAPLIRGPLNQLGGQLVNYGISQIPGLSSVSLSQLPGINLAKISDIPGLSQFPLFNPLSIKDWFVPFDIGFGMSTCSMGGDCHERNIDNTASGNMQDMSIPCMGATQSCAHIEVRRNGANPTQNIRWISKEQKVSGGSGLGSAICSKEPTGRFPLGPNPKVVLEKIDEKGGKIEFALYFSVHVGLDESDSAHCFGPFPLPFFGSAKEGQWILFGPNTVPQNSPFSSIGQQGGPGDASCTSPVAAGSGGGTYKGVNIDTLKAAIANRESLGSGGYSAIGSYVGNDGAGNHGRALGKYQFMSYGPAKDIIGAKAGGAQFLSQVDSPFINMAALSAVLPKLFTPAEQEGLMNSHLKHLVDIAQSRGLQGSQMIEMIAALHEGGDGTTHVSDTVYAQNVVLDYTSSSGSTVATAATAPTPACGATVSTVQPVECNGKKLPYIRPAPGPVTSPYGWRTLDGKANFHPGTDIANAIGTPIIASNCGVVDYAGWASGYGNYTCINHGGGIETCYGHQSVIEVKVGQAVKQGQVIGLMGSTGHSTGPHVHFEYRINGGTNDPAKYVPI